MPAIEDNAAAVSPKRARAYAARVMFIASVLGLTAVGTIAGGARWLVLQDLIYARGTGWLACGALWLSLCVSPVARLARRAFPNRRAAIPAPVLRRALGMTAAWFAMLHALAALKGPLQNDFAAALDTTHLMAGASALGVLLLLLLTSFDTWIKRLRLRYFKPLHRLAFAAALLVLQHLALSPSCPRWLVLVLTCTFAIGLALRALPKLPR